jgi:hypothetical protein
MEIRQNVVTERKIFRLVKMEIISKSSVPNEVIAVMFELCPNLQHLRI